MDDLSLSSSTLGEVVNTHILTLHCGKCSRTMLVDLRGPHKTFGDAYRVTDLARDVKCLCGEKPQGVSLLPIHIVEIMFPGRIAAEGEDRGGKS